MKINQLALPVVKKEYTSQCQEKEILTHEFLDNMLKMFSEKVVKSVCDELIFNPQKLISSLPNPYLVPATLKATFLNAVVKPNAKLSVEAQRALESIMKHRSITLARS